LFNVIAILGDNVITGERVAKLYFRSSECQEQGKNPSQKSSVILNALHGRNVDRFLGWAMFQIFMNVDED
jgi:hypothetical protein